MTGGLQPKGTAEPVRMQESPEVTEFRRNFLKHHASLKSALATEEYRQEAARIESLGPDALKAEIDALRDSSDYMNRLIELGEKFPRIGKKFGPTEPLQFSNAFGEFMDESYSHLDYPKLDAKMKKAFADAIQNLSPEQYNTFKTAIAASFAPTLAEGALEKAEEHIRGFVERGEFRKVGLLNGLLKALPLVEGKDGAKIPILAAVHEFLGSPDVPPTADILLPSREEYDRLLEEWWNTDASLRAASGGDKAGYVKRFRDHIGATCVRKIAPSGDKVEESRLVMNPYREGPFSALMPLLCHEYAHLYINALHGFAPTPDARLASEGLADAVMHFSSTKMGFACGLGTDLMTLVRKWQMDTARSGMPEYLHGTPLVQDMLARTDGEERKLLVDDLSRVASGEIGLDEILSKYISASG